ncbi:MAG: hypothetical protein AAFY29_16555 [Pseudomonadota bacterium]
MITLPNSLMTLQPATAARFRAALDAVLPYSERAVLELAMRHLRAAQEREVCPLPTHATEFERAVVNFADQFAVSVSSLEHAQVDALISLSNSAAVSALANAIYLIDAGLRLQLVVPSVLPPEACEGDLPTSQDAAPEPEPAADDSETVIAGAIAEFAAAAVLASDIDPLTSELVRLRCAQIHNCRLCGSLRQRSALESGLEANVASRVANYESGGFSDAQVAALRLCDTMIMHPSDANAALSEELAAFYSPTQIAEICFDVVKWSQQKALVALGSDAAPWEGIHILDFDGDGHPVFAGPVAA